MAWLDKMFWGNPLERWALALAICFVVAVGLRLLMAFATARLRRLVAKTANHLDDAVLDALGSTLKLTYLLIGVAAAWTAVELPAGATEVFREVLVAALIVQGGLWLAKAARSWLTFYRKQQLETDRATATAVGTISFVIQTAVWTMVLLIILSNLGVNITALITGLGVGGIAVALALQKVFSDLFASLSIVFDKPFVIGDFLIVGDHLGSVENVGLKTTRLRSLSGEQLIFANSDLLDSRLRNFGRMYERRVVFNIGVTYQTPNKKLKLIPGIIREAIEAEEKTRFDRSNFAKFGDFAQVFESVYYILAPDYNLYMEINERINLAIRERFEQEGIEFAYPTQMLYLQRTGADADGAAEDDSTTSSSS